MTIFEKLKNDLTIEDVIARDVFCNKLASFGLCNYDCFECKNLLKSEYTNQFEKKVGE